ncbi:MAG: methylated-DNA--[protein]-cysteine S-methyltransferase [Anaerolineae bacterium]|jgi:O-6-methylguanine DNA methyltransferase
MALFCAEMDSPAGLLRLATTEVGLCKIALGGEEEHFLAWLAQHIGQEPQRDPDALRNVQIQLREYFSRLRRRFDLALDLRGTPFQRAVWWEIAAISYGTTVTYGELARRLDRGPEVARAIGGAAAANPVPIVIPCHRVVGADGSLVGYGGGLAAKAALLRLEGVLL